MFKLTRLLIFNFIGLAAHLAADPILPGVVAATDGDPSMTVAGCVNAITGDLVLSQEDLSVRGAIALPIRRCYASGNGKGYDCGWHLFFPHFHLNFIQNDAYSPEIVTVTLPSGSAVRFCANNKKNGHVEIKPIIGKHAIGVTNNATGVLSGRTNFKNSRVHYKNGKKHRSEVRLTTGEGLSYYYETFTKENRDNKFVLVREELPNGCWILYEHDKYGRPTLAKVVNPAQNKVFSWARFHWDGPEKENHNVTIETSDRRKIRYTFERRKGKDDRFEGPHRFYLKDITGDLPLHEQVVFASPPKKFNALLTEFKINHHTQQKVAYHYPQKKTEITDEDDLRCNRVKELRSYAGPQGEEVTTHRFSYPNIHWKESSSCCEHGGVTTVTGPDGFKTEYQWTRELRPQCVRHYDHSQRLDEHLYVWGVENTHEVGDLKMKALIDGDGRFLWIKTYDYDEHYNPIKESFRGNLTGTYNGHFSLNQRDIQGGEAYNHYYRYSSDGKNLLIEDREDNGRITRYQYLPGTALITAKLTGNAERIWQREIFEYDEDHLLKAEIVDDGSSDNLNDLRDVNQRLIKRTYRREDGLSERIEERAFDLTTHTEVLLKTTLLHYTDKLLLAQQDVIDSAGQLAYSLNFVYDDKDRLIQKTDPNGQITTYTYDHRGLLSTSTHPNGKVEIIQYDPIRRPIVLSEISPEGQAHVERFAYNAQNHKTASTDAQGHTTHFSPDPLGRNKQISHPDGSHESFVYNAMGVIVQHANPIGAITKTAYNAYGKPSHIQYFNGTQESFIYDPSGRLIQTIDKLGTSKNFTYDLLGRVLQQTTLSREGVLLREERNEYRGSQLVRHINPLGVATEYQYDCAGRKISEHTHGVTTRFAYDALGRLAEISDGEVNNLRSYDPLDRVTQEKTTSQEQELLSSTSFQYDPQGNLTQKTTDTLQGPSIEQTLFDAFDRPIATIDPLGHKTTIRWDETIPHVLRKITTDPLGAQVIETIGAIGRVTSKTILSPDHRELANTIYTYDAEGNCIREEVALPSRTIVTEREYSLGKLVTLIEAAGTPEKKLTRYEYTGDLLTTVVKNDGVALHYTYDPLGRIATCQASTGEGYHYEYDALDRMISVTDLTRGLVASREYDPSGALQNETFLHGLEMHYERDPFGNPLKMILPDQSAIAYQWRSHLLREITRFDIHGTHHYRYRYEQYELTGQPLTSSLIAGLGRETQSYDIAQRATSRTTPFHSQIAEQRNALGSLLTAQTSLPGFNDTATYTYDSLQQLTSEKSSLHRHTFSFDAHGTPLMRDEKECQTNSLCQIEQIGESDTYTYTPAGNLSFDGRFYYRYDAFDRLIEALQPGQIKVEYVYDSWHRRMQKIIYNWKEGKWAHKMTRSYLYDGMLEIGAVDEAGNIVEFRVLGNTSYADTGATVAIECGGQVFAPLHDLRGDIVGLVETQSRKIVETYHFSAFGQTTLLNIQNAPIQRSLAQNPWFYFSKRTDEETGLVLFGRRYYHPQLGHWITPDPAQTLDHSNLHLFLRANPLNLYDALGLLSAPRPPESPYVRFDPSDRGPAHAIGKGLSTIARPFGYALYYGASQLPIPYVREGIMEAGSYLARNKRCVVNYGQLYQIDNGKPPPPGKAVISVNGMGNSLDDALNSAAALSEELGHSVWALYTPSQGLILDGVDYGLARCGLSTRTTRFAKSAFEAVERETKLAAPNHELDVSIRAHSKGCLLTERAFRQLRTENSSLGQHTSLYTLGSPINVDTSLFRKVEARSSKWDPVGYLSFILRPHRVSGVTFVAPVGGFPGLDHGINGATYRQETRNICSDIKERWGLE